MTFWRYYGLVFRRAWDRAFDRARRFWYLAAIALGVFVSGSRHYFPAIPSERVDLIAEFAWAIPFAALVIIFLSETIRAPHYVYVELLSKFPDRTRADIRERLGNFLFDGLRLSEEARQYGMTDQVRDRITTWIVDVSVYLASDVSPSATAQFRNASKLELRSINFGDHERVLNGISEGCSYLSKFIDRYA